MHIHGVLFGFALLVVAPSQALSECKKIESPIRSSGHEFCKDSRGSWTYVPPSDLQVYVQVSVPGCGKVPSMRALPEMVSASEADLSQTLRWLRTYRLEMDAYRTCVSQRIHGFGDGVSKARWSGALKVAERSEDAVASFLNQGIKARRAKEQRVEDTH